MPFEILSSMEILWFQSLALFSLMLRGTQARVGSHQTLLTINATTLSALPLSPQMFTHIHIIQTKLNPSSIVDVYLCSSKQTLSFSKELISSLVQAWSREKTEPGWGTM